MYIYTSSYMCVYEHMHKNAHNAYYPHIIYGLICYRLLLRSVRFDIGISRYNYINDMYVGNCVWFLSCVDFSTQAAGCCAAFDLLPLAASPPFIKGSASVRNFSWVAWELLLVWSPIRDFHMRSIYMYYTTIYILYICIYSVFVGSPCLI